MYMSIISTCKTGIIFWENAQCICKVFLWLAKQIAPFLSFKKNKLETMYVYNPMVLATYHFSHLVNWVNPAPIYKF